MEALEHTLRRSLERMAERLAAEPTDMAVLQNLEVALDLLHSLPFKLNLRKVQNLFYAMLGTVYPDFKKKSEQGDTKSREWIGHFLSLGERLSVRIIDT